MCFQKGVFTIQKGPRIRVGYNDPQKNIGVICEADDIPFQWGKKEAAWMKSNSPLWIQGFAMK